MFATAQPAFSKGGLISNPHRSDADYRATTMNNSSSRADFNVITKSPVVLPILGCVLLGFAIVGSASVVTNLVFDLIGYR